MPGTDRKAVARVLEQIAAFLELKGENQFRVRAFRSAARAVAGLPGGVDVALRDGSLASAKGIGPATLQIVQELADTGHASLLGELRAQVPVGLVEMLDISGLGVSKVRVIHETLGIDSIPELEAAARDGRLAALPRFGPKTAENVLRGIQFLRQTSGFRLSHHATEEAATLQAALGALPGVLHAHVAGDVRRRMEVVADQVIVLVADAPPDDIFGRIAQVPGVHEFAGQDERRVTLRFAGGSAVQVVVTTTVNAGAVLVQATGSEAHLRLLSEHAAARGFALHGAALWRGSSFVPTPDEATLYGALGLALVPPELREGAGELAAAADGTLPRLVEEADIRGFLHCHTNYSDGSNTVAEIAAACRAAGYAYVGITDHSEAAAYAGGLDADDLRRQWDEIDAANERLAGIRVLKGIEADILQDGRVDFPERVLEQLDFVIASVHSRFGLDERAMTARMLTALDNPFVTIIGHPTGRLLLAREPYAVDLDAVIGKAADVGVAMEINADPRRLDLDWRVVRDARRRGGMFSIGADAHGLAGIRNMVSGVGVARKAWLEPDRLLNTRSVDDFLAFARRRRG
jgi:DNA polymerase (family 10)